MLCGQSRKTYLTSEHLGSGFLKVGYGFFLLKVKDIVNMSVYLITHQGQLFNSLATGQVKPWLH